MVEGWTVVLSLVCVALSLAWYLWRAMAPMQSAVNLPPARSKKLPQSQTMQRQDEERDPVVLYGTTTGTSWQFAEQLAREARNRFDLNVRVTSLDDYDYETELPLESLAIIIVPTYEGGTPNATTKNFYDHILDIADDFRVNKNYNKLAYAVFGLGDTVYGNNFCTVGRHVDEALKKLDANRILSRGAGDAQYSAKQFEVWMNRLWPSMLAALGEKDKLTSLRKEEKQKKKMSTLTEYKSDEENDDKEPLADVEDMGESMKAEEEEDDDESEEWSDLEEGAERKTLITPQLSAALTKQGYKLIGTHSGVKLCRWTKAMLRGRGGCYKHTFYNITSYQCMEMTPSLACANKCTFCWRHHKNPVAKEWKWQMDQPEFLIEQSIEKHRGMINQCKGVPGVVPERFEEAFNVRHCALSLVGEPIIYPQINRFLDLLHERKISSFMVTNAQFPKEIKELKPVTQMYLSIDAATPDSLKKIDRPVFPDFWQRFLDSIDALREKGQRTVFRFTLVKDWNMEELQEYSNLILRGMPDFIEVKGVTYCGNSKASPLTIKNTPYHEEVCMWVQKLVEMANKTIGSDTYELACEHQHSVCFLIANKKKFYKEGRWHTWIDYEKFHQLLESGEPFTSIDYMAPTADWAVFGASEKGFDPEEKRFYRNGKEGKREQLFEEYENQGC